MTPEEMAAQRAMLASRILFNTLDAAAGAIVNSDDAFIQALISIRRQLDLLPPPGDLMREKAWKEMRPAIAKALNPWSQTLGRETIAAIVDSAPEQGGWILRHTVATDALQGQAIDPISLKIGPSSIDLPGASAERRARGDFSQNERSIETPNARMVPVAEIGAKQMETAAAEFMLRSPDNIIRIIGNTKVNGASMTRLFGVSVTQGGRTLGQETTPFAKFARKRPARFSGSSAAG